MKRFFQFLAAMLVGAAAAHAAISIGPAGSSGTITFSNQPSINDGWSTVVAGGGSADFTALAQLAAAAQTNVAANITNPVGTTPTVPNIAAANIPRWNSSNSNLQSVATTASYLVLMATLQNNSGSDSSMLTVSYTLGEQHASGSTVVEEIPGLHVFYSLTGASGSWVHVPALSGSAPGTISAGFFLGGTWANGSTLYMLWVDDNANANRSDTNDEEGGYTIDDVSFSTAIPVASSVSVSSPTNGSTFPQGVPIVIRANATMANSITSVAFFDNGFQIGNDPDSPYSTILSNASLGNHSLTARATDNTGAFVDSTNPVQITIVSNIPPSITITSPVNGATFVVGDNIASQVTVSDSDGSVSRVEFYVDGTLAYADNAAPFRFELGDALAGTHIVQAVAVDDGNRRATNSITIFVISPPNVTWFVNNGSAWKYLDDGTDQATAWLDAAFNDSGWSNGIAELGYGDIAQDRPERTVVRFGPDANAKFATTYFRKSFNVGNPGAFTDGVLRVLRDDRVRVYLNGTQIFSDITNNPVTYQTYATPTAPDDGTIYTTTNVPLALFNAGVNVIAAEVHQDAGNSSDISFDLMLGGQTPQQPYIRIARGSGNVRLEWFPSNWVLQIAPEIPASGAPAWSDVPVTSPYFVDAAFDKRFFRAVSTDGTECTPEVVGYVNLSLPPGACWIGNPLDGTNNHLNTIMPLAADGSQDGFQLYRWNHIIQDYGQAITWFASTGWVSSDPAENYILNPGEGVAYQNRLRNPVNVTFVGTARQGAVTNLVRSNFSIQANPLPISGTLPQFGFPQIEGMSVQFCDAGQIVIYQYFGGIWEPSPPVIEPGRGFVVSNPGAPVNWTRTFFIACSGRPQIVQHPESQSVLFGNNATFGVSAIGEPPLSYQWFFGVNPIPGATGPSFTRFNAQLSHSGNYFVVVSNAFGAVTSAVAALKVYGPVVINEWMAINTGIVRDPADNDPDDWFELHNASAGPINLGGFRLTDNLGNPNMFFIPAGTTIPAGGYLLFWADNEVNQGTNHVNFVLNNNGGSIGLFTPNNALMDSITYSNPVPNISLGRLPDAAPMIAAFNQPTPQGGNPTGITIVQQPVSQTVNCYGTVTFSVQAAGALPLTYHWQRNGCEPLARGSSPTLTISNVTLADIGNYSVIVSNAFGRISSEDASLVVNPSPVQPRLSLANGTDLVISWPRTCLDYSLDQSSDLNSPIRWSHSGRLVSGNGTNNQVTIPLRDAKGFFRLSTPSTRILSQPRGQRGDFGKPVSFNVAAIGTPPITYQWRLNGRDLPFQTNSTLAFDVISNGNFGLYECVVEGPDMAIITEPAVLRPDRPETTLADNFADRRPLPTDEGSLFGNTTDAKLEPGEPMHADAPGGRSVWFSWQPKFTGIATVDTSGTGFDTLLAVYTGTNLVSLRRIADDDDSTEELWSRVRFNVNPNQEYQIAVDGLAGAGGHLTLNWIIESTDDLLPIIVKQPQDIVVRSNQPAAFSVIVTNPGTAPLTYQWFRNGQPVPGQNGPDLVIPNAQLPQVAEYFVVVGAGQRFVQSRSVTLQISTDPEELRFVRKLNFDFICETDVGTIPSPDRKSAVPVMKLAPSSAGTIASSSITTYSSGGGCPPYICKRRSYYKWTAVTTGCSEGQSTTMTFNLAGSTGLGNTTLSAYYITTDLYLACATNVSSTLPTVSFTAEYGKTYRVLVGKANAGGTIVLSYTNSPCAP